MNRPLVTPEVDREAKAGLARAVEFANRGALAQALDAAAAVLAIAPGFVPAHYLRADLLRATGRGAESLAAYAAILALEFKVDARARPFQVARAVAEVAATAPVSLWMPRLNAFSAFGVLLAQSPLGQAERSLLATCAALRLRAADEREFEARMMGVFALLGFDARAPAAHTHWVFEQVALPWMQRAFEADDVGAALSLERAIYLTYVKQTETEPHFAASFARWKDGMRALGARYAASLPPVARGAPGSIPRIAFFVQNITNVAHVQMAMDMLEGHAALPEPLFEPHVFCFAADEPVLRALEARGLRITVLFKQGPGERAAFANLRRDLIARGIDLLVWISLALGMPFGFGMRLAPKQVWWALKYHALEMPEIDGYITGGGLEGGTKEIGGRTWRAGPVAGSDWVAQDRSMEAARVRQSFGPCRVLYGCFGREEKLADPAFLDAVSDILRAVPEARFLWTGRHQHAGVQAHFERAGVAARSHYIGWVDTKLHAQVIDVFLDSFPFPCGFTLYEAMAAGKPVVLFDSPAAKDTGAHALVAPLLEQGDPNRENARAARAIYRPGGEDLYLRAKDAADYVALAVRLAGDEALRARAGGANRAFVERFLADRPRAARIYAGHFLAILAGKPA